MTNNGGSTEEQQRAGDVESSLEQIKRRLTSVSGKTLLQGPLLMRSHALRKWNERWVILDPTTGRMEYKVRRNEPTARGIVKFDDNSTVALSAVNFHGLPMYEGCCFYIGTSSKKDHLFVAQTSGAARAWISTLQATQSVLKAQREAVNFLSGNSSAKLGTLAAALSAAVSTALECSKEVEAAMQVSMRNSLGEITSTITDGPMDDFTIMKETLRVKDEELQNLCRDIRARDSTITDLAGKLSDTAEAAESAAAVVRTIDQQQKMTFAEIERLTCDYEKQLSSFKIKLKESEEKALALEREREELVKQRDAAIQEAELWRFELAKAREHAILLEGALVRANEKAQVAEAEARARGQEAEQIGSDSVKDKQEFLAYVDGLQAELQREQTDSDEAFEGETQSCSGSSTKHVNSYEKGEDEASQRPVDHIDLASAGEGKAANGRGVAADTEGADVDVPTVGQNANDGDHEQRVEFTSLKDVSMDEN